MNKTNVKNHWGGGKKKQIKNINIADMFPNLILFQV